MSYLESRESLIEFISRKKRSAVEGSSTQDHSLYHEIPFPGYEEVSSQRTWSAQRARIISEHLDFSAKTVLDVGCNIGFFSFEFARLGATCWGIDYDPDSILVANSLKHIHRVDDAHFVCGSFSEELIEKLLREVGYFDVILLNSVVHWLIYHLGSVRRVLCLLNRLAGPGKQTIFYEPSSSKSAYFPEELRKRNIRAFFAGLGVDHYREIGKSFASNIGSARRVFMGERDVHGLLQELDQKLGNGASPGKLAELGVTLRHSREDKLCLEMNALFVKTVNSRFSPYNRQLKNELDIAYRLSRYPEYVPILIAGVELDGRMYLAYEKLQGPSLRDAFVCSRHILWIVRELKNFTGLLKRLGLVHNDLKPQNVLLETGNREIRIVDYEFSGPGRSWDREADDQYLPFEPQNLDEEAVLLSQMQRVGGDHRSSYGPGFYENDRYAVNKIIGLLRNRPVYFRDRVRHYATEFIRIPQMRRVKRLLVRLRGTWG